MPITSWVTAGSMRYQNPGGSMTANQQLRLEYDSITRSGNTVTIRNARVWHRLNRTSGGLSSIQAQYYIGIEVPRGSNSKVGQIGSGGGTHRVVNNLAEWYVIHSGDLSFGVSGSATSVIIRTKASLSASTDPDYPYTGTGWKYHDITLSIPAANATITGGSTTFNDEQNPTINYSNPAGNSATTLQAGIYKTDGTTTATGYINISKTASSYTFSLTEGQRQTLRQWLATSQSMSVRIYLRSVVGGSDSRPYRTVTLTLKDGEPIFSDYVYEDTNSTITTITGNDQVLVQGKSTLRVTVPVADKATAQKEATMSKYTFNISGVSNEKAWSNTNDVVQDMGTISAGTNQSLTVTAIDSRNKQKAVVKQIGVVPYTPPAVSVIGVRDNNFENNTTVTIGGSMSLISVGGVTKNAVNTSNGVQYRIREVGGTWGSWIDRTSSTNSAGVVTVSSFTLDLDNTKNFEIQARITDKLETTTISRIISAGIGIFRISTYDELLYNKEQPVLTSHVGMIVMSTTKSTAESMKETHGGTWVAWGVGRVPVGVDIGQTEFNTVEKTGGHKLLQSHNHTATTNSTGAHTHTATAGYGPSNSHTGLGKFSESINPRTGTSNQSTNSAGAHSHTVTVANSGGGDSENLQPYQTVYMWKRTV